MIEKTKVVDILLTLMVIGAVIVVLLSIFAAIIDHDNKSKFDAKCLEAGGLPLRYTWHYDDSQKKIEYTCLSVNAVIDVE
jgi:hypothetical protein